jgi:hypothetical protein
LRDDGDEGVVDVGVELGDGGDDAEVLEVLCDLCRIIYCVSGGTGEIREGDERAWMMDKVEGGTIPTNCSSTVSNATWYVATVFLP